jgi:glutaredoxin
MPSRPRVVLFTRPECHLCDEARVGLERLRAEGLDFELEEVDIETDDELHARFLERIPVVELDGEIVSELHLDADALTARLRS